MNEDYSEQTYNDILCRIYNITAISPKHGNALMDILGVEKYEEIIKKASAYLNSKL